MKAFPRQGFAPAAQFGCDRRPGLLRASQFAKREDVVMADIKTESITGGRPGSGAHRVVALCGPYLSGKTSLLESILYATGAIGRRGSTRAGTSIGDGAAEARKRNMSTEIN